MTLLNPSYLSEAKSVVEKTNESSNTSSAIPVKRKVVGDDRINPKLKQFYEAKTKIKPFFTGGKITILNDDSFVCQCGTGIKVVTTSGNLKLEKSENEMEIDDEVGIISVNDLSDEKNDAFSSSFSISREIDVPMDDIISYDACPITNILITSHKSKLLRIWCLLTGEIIKTVKSLHHLPIGFVEINKSKSLDEFNSIFNDSDDKQNSFKSEKKAIEAARGNLSWSTVSGAGVKLWETGGNQMSRLIQVDNIASIGYVRWNNNSSDSKLFVAERHIYILGSTPEKKQFGVIHTLEGHYSQVTGIEFGEKDILISGGRDKVVILWDMKNNYNKLSTIPFPNPIEGLLLKYPNDLYVAVNPSEIKYFDLKNKRMMKKSVLSLNEDEIITGIFPKLCNKKFQSENTNQTCLVSTHTGAIYEVLLPEDSTEKMMTINHQYVGSLDEILSAVFWVDGTIAVSNNTNVIKVYTLKTGSCAFLRGHKDIVLSLSTYKNWLVSGGKDNKVIFWENTSVTPNAILEGHLASVTSVSFNPTQLIAYSVSEDNFLKAWDQKHCLNSVIAHDKEINSVHCSPNGALVVTGSRDKTAKVWDSETLKLMGTLKGHKKGVWDSKFSSWDQLVATSSADTTIKIWSLATFECVQTLQGHLSSVLQCQFVNAGLQIVSVSSDGSFKTWELKTSTCLATEECGNDKIWTVDAHPDGSVLVTGSADSALILWHDITEEKVIESVNKRQKLIQDEQRLNNVIRSGKWMVAFRMAIDLDRPYTLLKVMREVSDVDQFQSVICLLTQDQRSRLLTYITQWNTNTKTSTEAQVLLNVVFKTVAPQELRYIQPIKLLSYTDKHLTRLKRMQQQIVILDHMANS